MAYTNVDNPELYFQTKLYTGNGSTQAITFDGSENMQPDFIWCKSRNNVRHHYLADVIRGVKGRLRSDANNAEYTANSTSGFDSFDSDGFTLEEDSSSLGLNESGHTMVSWNWKAGGSASSNSDGSITSSVSANTTAGFSIVSYTGTGSNATIGHGLGSAPQVVLLKERNGTNNWLMSHQPLSASLGDYTRFMTLNSTGAVSGAGNVVFQGSAFTSSVFNVGTSSASNGSSQTFIAYCFAEKKGYSKFGSYIGNGNADGTFVYTGFKPAFVITKRTDGAVDWYMFDNKRPNSFNVINAMLRPSATSTELDDSSVYVDFLSNGFKWRGNNAGNNTSGGSYIYMAFAESPFVNSAGAVPTNAR